MRYVIILLIVIAFGLHARSCRAGDAAKWAATQEAMTYEREALAECLGGLRCSVSTATAASMAAMDVENMNVAVNRYVRPIVDTENEWQSPLTTLERGTGDCEDYAILKYMLLEARGLRPVLILTMNHAVVTVQMSDGWVTLDNRTSIIAPYGAFRGRVVAAY